jgi:hypothetical protein
MAGALGAACSSAKKKTTPELGELEGHKVAVVEIDGEETARKVAQVALINQLVQKGSFEIVPKQDVEAARTAIGQDPTDWLGIARRAGADYALKMRVLEFVGDTREGYSSETVEDSQLQAEQGGDGKTEHVYKVRALDGHVRFEVQIADVREGGAADLRTGIAEAQDRVTVEAKTEAAHLPPKLRFLEKLANQAFARFFEQYR